MTRRNASRTAFLAAALIAVFGAMASTPAAATGVMQQGGGGAPAAFYAFGQVFFFNVPTV